MVGTVQPSVSGHLVRQGASLFIQAGSQLLVTAVLGRFLEPAEFGVVAAANIAITLMQMLAEGGLASAIVKADHLQPATVGTALGLATLVAVTCYIILAVLAVPLESFFAIAGMAWATVVLGLSFFPLAIAAILEGVLQRELRFDVMLRVNLAAMVFGYVVPALVLAVLGAGIWALLLPNVSRFLVKAVLLGMLVRGRVRLRWIPADARGFVRFSLGLTQDRCWSWLFAQTAPAAVGRLFGQAQLGTFYLGVQLGTLPSQHVSSVLASVYLPILSRGLRDPAATGRAFVPVWLTSVAMLSFLGLVLALNGEVVVSLLLGPQWTGAVPVFQAIVLASGLRAGIQLSDAVNVARGQVFQLAAARALSTAALAAAVFTVHEGGIVAVAYAYVGAHVVMMALSTWLAVRRLALLQGIPTRDWIRILAVSVLALGFGGTLLITQEVADLSSGAFLAVSVAVACLVVGLFALLLLPWLRAPAGAVPGARPVT